MGRSRGWAAALAAVAVLAAACSAGGDDTDAATDTTAVEPVAEGSSGCAAGVGLDGETGRRQLEHDGVTREYDLSVPVGPARVTPAPLLVDLHGFSSNAAQQGALTDLAEQGGERGYVVVTPQALEVDVPLTTGTLTTTFWNIDPAAIQPGFEPADDLGFLHAVLDDVGAALCLDPTRFHATGMSNGAGMTMGLICGDDTRFAAAAPVAGANMVGTCEPGESIPIAAFHGDADPLIPYDGGQVVGQDYVVVGVEERLSALAERAGCDPEPTVDAPFDDIESRTWTGCPDGIDFVLTTVLGGGHTWPGASLPVGDGGELPTGQLEFIEGFDFSSVAGNPTDSIDATPMVLDFFDAHPGEG